MIGGDVGVSDRIEAGPPAAPEVGEDPAFLASIKSGDPRAYERFVAEVERQS